MSLNPQASCTDPLEVDRKKKEDGRVFVYMEIIVTTKRGRTPPKSEETDAGEKLRGEGPFTVA